jgi:hypothetical protein
MHQDDPGLEQRLSRFEAQLDRFSLALHQWQAHEPAHAGHSSDIDQRIRTIEETLDREAHALRQMHEEPLKQLQAQAASLKDLVTGFQMLLADVQRSTGTGIQTRGSSAAWPLERVVTLHDELRRNGNGGNGSAGNGGNGHAAHGNGNGHTAHRELPGEVTGGMFQRASVEVQSPSDEELFHQRRKYVAIGAAAIAAVLLTLVAMRWVGARLDEATARVASAEQQVAATTKLANQEVQSAREDANRQIAEARQLAQRAETVGVILAAPDLIRFNLTNPLGNGASAQLLWSRTRGVVLTGSRLPATPADNAYQLWLMTTTQPVSAGLFVPDAAGRANLVVEPPQKIGPVVGAAVTVEPTAGRLAPTGQVVLTRAQ